ncbi:DNA polymerase III, tau subunit [Micromonospora pattaloongensis]|uniref:DNA polymerase III subunit gamma/tau n=1 Tax=Micromonospora pattaloongensis TaxID=405436 RepID=A0A1H3HF75_9ACTN|nr:DNA polymerase III subunit gamma and tau [Micromonospora pattaloongensis]SDY13990.1 DNA polymerase III, tau subunit [Micromonospora pattaloongensis]
MALALYRKYRPRTFAEVIGQEHVTEPLSQALRTGRLNHAYLFSGPRGCGKTSSARILARSLNCEQGPTPEPCGSCDSCRSLAADGAGSIDVIEIDAASHGGVDDARELRERAFFAPASSRFKIYVIDEAHMVSPAGFNALLKLVEEPPEYVKFIFATTEPEKVLGTIKSRTHHYPFRLIPPGVLRPYLEQLCEAEGVTVDPAVFPLVVRAGGGSARDSLSVLDQLIAGAGPEGVGYARAVALLGVTDGALLDEMCDALAAGDGAAAYATIDRVAEAGHDSRRFASDLLERLRDLIVLQQVPDAVQKGLIDGPADQIERMTAQAERLGPATLSRCADIVHNGLVEMRGTTAPRLLLELVTARMLLPGAEDSTGALLQRLERMERRLTLTGGEVPPVAAGPAATPAVRPSGAPAPAQAPAPPAPPAEPPAPPAEPPAPPAPSAADRAAPAVQSPSVQSPSAPPASTPAATPRPATPRAVPPEAVMPDPATPEPARPDAVVPGQLDAAAVRRVWDEVLGMVARKSKRAAAVVREATVRDVDGQTLVLTFRHSVHANMLTSSPDLLVEAVYEVLGVRWQIRCEVAGDQRAAATAAPARPASPPAQPPRPPVAPAERVERGATTARVAPASGPAGDSDWPEPARPGGVAAAAPAADNGGWPTPATPGGGSPAPAGADPAGGGGATAKSGSGATATPGNGATAKTGNGVTAPEGNANGGDRAQGNGVPGPGLAAARAAAAGRGARPGAPAPAQGQAQGAWRDGTMPEEPPYDPEYDGPPKAAVAAYEGFDPGDEPLDEVIDERTARQTSEQQALQLLQQTLGAEKIGEEETAR